MRKRGPVLFLCLTLLFLVTACSAKPPAEPLAPDPPTEAPKTPAEPLEEPSPPPAQEQPQESTPEEVSSVETKNYYVDTKNFNIHPVDQEADEDKIALLTFDDGPRGEVTTEILDILDKYGAKSIWFISGFNYGWDFKPSPEKAEKFKTLVKEIHDRGHLIANHTWSHPNLRKLTPEQQKREIVSMNELLMSITGEKVTYFRPPFGAYTDVQKQIMKEEGMQTMNWSVGSLDWEHKDPDKVIEQVVSTMHNGGNILMHDLPVQAQALDTVLKKLTEMGYKFVLPTEVKNN